MELNGPAPDFELPDLEGELHHLSDHRGRIVILNFWSCECPHSERGDREILALCVQWPDDLVLLPVASNRIETHAALREGSRRLHLPLVLWDRECAVADLYQAQTTPHVFVIDRRGILRYRGAVDDVGFARRKPARFYLDEAVEAVLQGRLPALPETRSFGCTIVREALE
jgi:peroxiredoxin